MNELTFELSTQTRFLITESRLVRQYLRKAIQESVEARLKSRDLIDQLRIDTNSSTTVAKMKPVDA